MRILHVINNLQPAGAETLLRDLVLRLRTRGLSVDVLLLQSTGSWIEKEIEAAGIRIMSCGKRSLYSPLNVLRLMNAVDQCQYDVAHVHLFPSQLWTACAAWAAGWKFPLVTSEHSTANRRRIQLLRPIDRWMYSRYNAAIGVSEAVSEKLSWWLESREISVVRNGIDLKRFQVKRSGWLKRELGIDVPLLLSIGRFDGLKDHSTAVRALRHLPHVHLALVGDGPKRMEVQRLAEATNV